MSYRFARKAHRRGNYTVLMVLLLGVLFGFGALAIDVSMIRLAQTEAQDIADAASHAAIAELKDSHDMILARQAAEEVVAANTLAGDKALLLGMNEGSWDPASRTFSGGASANAIQVRVGRTGNQAVRLALGTLLGWYSVNVAATSTAATQSVQVILVMDITGSWEQRNFLKARQAALTFLDSLHQNHGPEDKVGMTVFLNRYGWEYTPLTAVEDSFSNASLVTNKWAKLNVGSYAGDYQATWATGTNLNTVHVACKAYGRSPTPPTTYPYSGLSSLCTSNTSTCYKGTSINKWSVSVPAGGCFPGMPRYYWDEAGTDHTTGIGMARRMFEENVDPTAYKAMVVLTDGQPSSYGTSEGLRRTQGWVEPFRQFKYSGSHSAAQIERDTPLATQALHTDLGVNTWFVSFRDDRPFMANAVTGDGWYAYTNNASDIVPIFEEIARSLPVAIVN